MNTLYPNLPGVFLEKVDGKLILSPETREHVIAVFGTTDNGPSYLPSVITDFSHATELFGQYGTGIQGIFEVMQGKPETIALVRIGSTPAKVFLNGGQVKITFRDHGPATKSYYGLYIGGTTKEFKIFDLTKKNQDGSYVLVYSNLQQDYELIMSKTDVFVDVENDNWDAFFTEWSSTGHTGANAEFGSESNPVSFETIYNTTQFIDPFFSMVDGKKGSDDYKITNMKLFEAMMKGFFVTSTFNFDQVFVPGAYINASNIEDDEKPAIWFAYDQAGITPAQGDTLTIKIYTKKNSLTPDYTWTVSADLGDTISNLYQKMAMVVSDSILFSCNYEAPGTAPYPTVEYLKITSTPGSPIYNIEFEFTDIATSTTTALNTSEFQSIFDNRYLENVTNITTVPTLPTISGNAPESLTWHFTDPYFIKGSETLKWAVSGAAITNYEIVISGDNVFIVINPSELSATADDYIVIDYVRVLENALPYYKFEEVDGELNISWSYEKSIGTDGLNEYHVANFGYEIAKFCHEVSTNFKECLGVVGVTPPKSTTHRNISKWIGKKPVVDEWGQIVQDGTGLLGYKYLAGSTTTSPGFYYTQNRYMDGIPVLDRDGTPIDIGKYLAVVIGWGLMKNGYKGKPYGYFASCEGVFAAVDEMLPPNISATNKEIPNFVVQYRLSLEQINDLTATGYTVVTYDITKGVSVVVDSPTVANPNSDYQRRQTVKIFKYLNQQLRNIMKPFIGGPMNTPVIESQKSLIRDMFENAMRIGLIQTYNFQIKATPRMQVLNYEEIHYTVQPAFELKQVFGYAAMQVPTKDLSQAISGQ